MYKLKSYAPCDLNKRDVYEAFLKVQNRLCFPYTMKMTRESLIINVL